MTFDNSELKTALMIRAVIGAEGTTVAAVAERIGTTRQNLAMKMKRDNFSEAELREIADALGYDLVIEFRKRKPEQ